MALHFVAKAVIRSEDGVTFNKETKIQKSDQDGTKLKAHAKGPVKPIGKSLAQQLQENEEKKDAEWKAANNPFQPPPSMTAEEAEFLAEKEAERRRKDAAIEELSKTAAAEFQTARLDDVTTKPAEELPKVQGLFQRKELESNDTEKKVSIPVVAVKKKKKRKKGGEGGKKKKKKKGALALLGSY
mmetsp:Transcript_12371/g.18452  ORF Transcript_12371/g.18452 Transcript_12371/m.18452 type:complete len:185 (-) Transcript_12371:200-754(-)